jgi:hypothetical protein
MRPLPHHNIALFILDLRHQLAHLLDLFLQRVLWGLGLRHVDDSVDIEGNFFGVCAPVLVVEAVGVFAVFEGGEGVVAGGHAAFVNLVGAGGGFDLYIKQSTLNLQVNSWHCARVLWKSSRVYKQPRTRYWGLWESINATTHPEIHLQISAPAKLPISNLERNRHLVVLVQRFVEAFALVRLHLDVVSGGYRRRGEERKGSEQHCVVCCCGGDVWGDVDSLGSSGHGNGQVARMCSCKGHGGGTCAALVGAWNWTAAGRGEDITFHDFSNASEMCTARCQYLSRYLIRCPNGDNIVSYSPRSPSLV